MKTDDEIRQDVEDELEWEPAIDHRQIGVAVKDGVVSLTGAATAYSQKWRAERAVERVAGVRGIANDLEVRVLGERSDADIARAALRALQWSSVVPKDRVTVEVEKGHVTLKGELNHDFERRAAERALRDLLGVTGVTDLTTITPPVAPQDVTSGIEKTFKRGAVVDAHGITVEARGSTVILRGSVPSWHERYEAQKAAWKAPGVRSVENLITITN
jgi:osmotically-inducible protein OsmY